MVRETQNLSWDTLQHVAIAVSNMQRAIQWYTTRFNCTIHYHDDTWALLDFANIRLA